jgi:hypothetical protein
VNVCLRTVTSPCVTVIVALVNAISVIAADQFALGQPASAADGGAGATVVTLNVRFPFLTSDARSSAQLALR